MNNLSRNLQAPLGIRIDAALLFVAILGGHQPPNVAPIHTTQYLVL